MDGFTCEVCGDRIGGKVSEKLIKQHAKSRNHKLAAKKLSISVEPPLSIRNNDVKQVINDIDCAWCQLLRECEESSDTSVGDKVNNNEMEDSSCALVLSYTTSAPEDWINENELMKRSVHQRSITVFHQNDQNIHEYQSLTNEIWECHAPPVLQRVDKKTYSGSVPFLTFGDEDNCGTMENDAPHSFLDIANQFCQTDRQLSFPNIDINMKKFTVSSWKEARELLSHVHSLLSSARPDPFELLISSKIQQRYDRYAQNNNNNNNTNDDDDYSNNAKKNHTSNHHHNHNNISQKPTINIKEEVTNVNSCWAAVQLDGLQTPKWWNMRMKALKKVAVPTYDQIIVSSGFTDIGIHIDSFGKSKVPVDTYLTCICGMKLVIMMPPTTTSSSVITTQFSKLRFPFPDLPVVSVEDEEFRMRMKDVIGIVNDVGGYCFLLKAVSDYQRYATLFIPNGWHHWLLNLSSWTVLLSASQFPQSAVDCCG